MNKLQEMIDGKIYVSSIRGKSAALALDFRIAMNEFPRIAKLSYSDILQKYRRSVFGPLWITASTVAFIVGFALIGSLIFGADRLTYISSLSAGIIFWQFILTLLSEAAGSIYGAHAEIISERTSYLSLMIRVFLRNFISLLHNIPILILVVLFSKTVSWTIIFIIPGVILVSIVLFSLGLLLAILGTRFRDVIPAITMFLQFMFYFTPIFWPAESVQGYPNRLIIDLNPFYHLLELVRAPFLGQIPSLLSWLVVGALCVLSSLLALFILSKFRDRIVYWI